MDLIVLLFDLLKVWYKVRVLEWFLMLVNIVVWYSDFDWFVWFYLVVFWFLVYLDVMNDFECIFMKELFVMEG